MVNVITTDNEGCVSENKLFTGKNANEKAEAYFTKNIKKLRAEAKVDKELVTYCLEEGWHSYNGTTICLSHPEVVKE